MIDKIVLSNAIRDTLLSVRQAQKTVDDVTLRLATGKKVNSALDNPQNFFSSANLKSRANDYTKLLDGIGHSIRTIEEGLIGVQAVERLLNQAEGIATRSLEYIQADETDPDIFSETVDISGPPISTIIAADSPDVYFRLNETIGPIVDYGVGADGPVGASYQSGAAPNAAALYSNGSVPSVEFDGNNDFIAVDDNNMINLQTTTARTVELVFNADNTSGRQVLYEEGATVNGFTIYIDNGTLYFTAEDDNGGNTFANIDINTSIVAGQTYHVAFVYSAATNSFTGYLDGTNVGTVALNGDPNFPSHSGDIGIGGVNGSAQWHDGETNAVTGFNFDGRISDVAIYNTALETADMEERVNALGISTASQTKHEQFEKVMEELDELIIDANYRGVNLLSEENLLTYFNPEGDNYLVTEGADFSADGLGIIRTGFLDEDLLYDIIESVQEAKEEVRRFGTSLSSDLGIITSRANFTREKIENHKAGSEDLVKADINAESAKLLASQTRQNLGTTALSLAAQAQQTILSLFSGS